MNSSDVIVLSILVNVGVFLIVAFAVYMFYARLRDMADELRKFRIAYEMAQERKTAKAEAGQAEG
jgi:hypothetical protein